MSSQQIKCQVSSCMYNSDAQTCTLQSIEVGNTIPNAKTMHQTECASFKAE